jgi:hypothetical protein
VAFRYGGIPRVRGQARPGCPVFAGDIHYVAPSQVGTATAYRERRRRVANSCAGSRLNEMGGDDDGAFVVATGDDLEDPVRKGLSIGR